MAQPESRCPIGGSGTEHRPVTPPVQFYEVQEGKHAQCKCSLVERPVVERSVVERSVVERPVVQRPVVLRSVVERFHHQPDARQHRAVARSVAAGPGFRGRPFVVPGRRAVRTPGRDCA